MPSRYPDWVVEPLLTTLQRHAPEVFTGTPVVFAYLYGSHAGGSSHQRSDVDIAVYLDRADRSNFQLSTRLANELENRSGIGPIEPLLVLNEAPIALAGRVVEGGHLIYSIDEARRVRHFSETIRQYHDFKIHEERSARERLARLARD